MPDASITLREGEVRPVYATATLPGGTLAVVGTPTVRAYTAEGLQFTDDATSLAGDGTEMLTAAYSADASDIGPFVVGSYTLIFSIATLGSDGLSRTFEPVVRLEVGGVVGSGYPTGDDLAAYLTSLGIIDAATASATLARMNLGTKAMAAAREWERATDYRPFLAGDEDETRIFDPPTCGQLDLGAGLLSVTSLYTGVTPTSPGTLRTLGTDYLLEPANAAFMGEPYTAIVIRHLRSGFPSDWGWGLGWGTYHHSIEVTGRWGYQAELAAEIWQAILEYGAFLCAPSLSLSLSGGVSSVKVLSSQVSYGGSGGVSVVGQEAKSWETNFRRLAEQYRRMVL